MPKPVTFQGASNFKAELFALDVTKRFRGLSADGYYKGYGSELSCQAILNANYFFYIGSGAALVQGRMIINESETSLFWENPSAEQVGAVILHIETRPSNPANCVSFRVGYASTLAGISLTQQAVNAINADSSNKIYEVILYKFNVVYNGTRNIVSDLTRVLPAIDDVGQYCHCIFVQLNDYTPIYINLILPTPTAISTFNSLYAALRYLQPTDEKPYISCNGANSSYYSALYEISADAYNAKIYVSDTTIHSIEFTSSDVRKIRDVVIEL